MGGLTEKVEAIEKRLNDVFDEIKQSLTAKPGKPRHSLRVKESTGQPDWVKIFKAFQEISADVKSVKDALSARADISHPRSDASVTDTRVPPEANRQSQTESAIGGQRGVATTEPISTIPPSHGITTLSQSGRPIRGGASIDPRAILRCKYKDISETLNEAMLEEFSSDPRVKEVGYFKLKVEDLPTFALDQTSVDRPGEHHSTNFSYRRNIQGFVEVVRGARREVHLPSLPFLPSQTAWSKEQLKPAWESALKDPPTNMQYIIGAPLFPDIKLSPGKRLERIGGLEIGGMGSPYTYTCDGISFSALHDEELLLASLNLHRAGETKHWLCIYPADRGKLWDCMRREFPEMGQCSMAINHLGRLVPPSKLDEWGIRYSLDYTDPEEIMVTLGETLHQIWNQGKNHAISINVLFGSSPDFPPEFRFCTKESCGPHAITAADFRTAEREPLIEVQGNKRARRQPKKVADVTSKIVGTKRKADAIQEPRPRPGLAPEVGSFFQAVCGREAFGRICSLIRDWRDRSRPLFKDKNVNASAAYVLHFIGTWEGRSQLAEVLNRCGKVKLAEIRQQTMNGRIRADIPNLMDEIGWEKTTENRDLLKRYLQEGGDGKKCVAILTAYYSLSPPNRPCLDLSGRDIASFHSLLKYDPLAHHLCRIGATFYASIFSTKQLPEFKWETEDAKELSQMSVTELIPFMDEFPTETENQYDSTKYDSTNWPKPDSWDGDWPQNPMSVAPGEVQCDQCKTKGSCNCITMVLPDIEPRIMSEGQKGQGLRAIGTSYREGQILGELIGELVPPDTHTSCWAFEVVRPDLGEPVAQLYTGEVGNLWRKINHSLNPSAAFYVKKKSGCWRVLIIAIQDIPDGAEITANCGKRFLPLQECL